MSHNAHFCIKQFFTKNKKNDNNKKTKQKTEIKKTHKKNKKPKKKQKTFDIDTIVIAAHFLHDVSSGFDLNMW